MTVNRFVCPMVLPNGERLYAICTGDPADRASVRNTQIMATSAEECGNFIDVLARSQREGYHEGYRDGLLRGGELAAKERGRQLQGAFDRVQNAALGECQTRGKEFCDNLLVRLKAELTGRGYAPAASTGPCCQAEPESPYQPDPGHPLSGPYSGNDDVDEDSALDDSELE